MTFIFEGLNSLAQESAVQVPDLGLIRSSDSQAESMELAAVSPCKLSFTLDNQLVFGGHGVPVLHGLSSNLPWPVVSIRW